MTRFIPNRYTKEAFCGSLVCITYTREEESVGGPTRELTIREIITSSEEPNRRGFFTVYNIFFGGCLSDDDESRVVRALMDISLSLASIRA